MPKYTAFINIKKLARAGQQSTGIATLVHEQLTKGIKRVRHSIRGQLTTIKYTNPLSGKDLVMKNVYMPAGSKAARGVDEEREKGGERRESAGS
eukprot:3241335-Rhodomonas_salina.1